MSETFLESEIVSDQWVEHLTLKVDAAKLDAFQSTLKWAEVRGMNAFIGKLNTLEALQNKAAELRAKQNGVIVVDRPTVAWVVIPVETANNEVTDHNEKIRALHRAVQEFNAARNEFLSTFIARYIAPPVAQRNDPKPGERGPAPRVQRQVGGNFALPTAEAPQATLRPEDNKEYMRTLLSKNVDDMSDEEIAIIRGMYQKAGFRDIYEKLITAGNSEREALKRMREGMSAANARDNSSAFNQSLLAFARWLESKTNK